MVTSYGFNKICIVSKCRWVSTLTLHWAMLSTQAQLALAFQKYCCALALFAKIAALNHFLAPPTCTKRDPPHTAPLLHWKQGSFLPAPPRRGAAWARTCSGSRQLRGRTNYLPDTGISNGEFRKKNIKQLRSAVRNRDKKAGAPQAPTGGKDAVCWWCWDIQFWALRCLPQCEGMLSCSHSPQNSWACLPFSTTTN